MLGVSKKATSLEIKQAFRKKALKCHPDKTINLSCYAARKLALEEFQKINNAHDTLTDQTKRKQYDQNDNIIQPEETRTYQPQSDEFTHYNIEFANHRSFGRNCPVLSELCVLLDLMVNFFDFLNKKIVKTISGEKTPVFANMQEFKNGMFKPIPTSTARKVDELNEDIAWYIKNIKNIKDSYNKAITCS